MAKAILLAFFFANTFIATVMGVDLDQALFGIHSAVDSSANNCCLADYIEWFYNWTRRQSTHGYVSPVQFEKTQGA
jgi:hypothetical protein